MGGDFHRSTAPASVGSSEGHAFQGPHTLLVDLKLWTNGYRRCLLNILKLATRLSQHPSVLTYYRVRPAIPGPYPKLQSRGWTVLPQPTLPYVIQPFWFPSPLVYPVPSWPPGLLVPWLSPPPSLHGLAQGHVHSGPSQTSLPLATCSFFSTLKLLLLDSFSFYILLQD